MCFLSSPPAILGSTIYPLDVRKVIIPVLIEQSSVLEIPTRTRCPPPLDSQQIHASIAHSSPSEVPCYSNPNPRSGRRAT